MIRSVLTASLVLAAAAALPARANEPKTWYVYCDGFSHGVNYAVFSQNIWPHPETDNYGRRIGSAAEEFFEARHDVPLAGCSGVQFFDLASAKYSRKRTVRLHKKMGDRVYFFNLPLNVLPE